MRGWLQRNVLPVAALAGTLGGLAYVQLARQFGEPSIWVTLVAALMTIYGYLAESRPWPRVPMPVLLASGLIWLSCAVGNMLLQYL